MYEHDESTWVSSPIDVAEGGLLAIYRGVDSPRVLIGTEPAIVQAVAEQHGLNDGVVDVPPPIESKLGLEEVPWPAARAHMFGRLQVPFGDQPRGVPDDLIDASLRWLRARSAEAEPVILVAGRPVPADWTRAPSILRALLSGIQTIAIAADDPSRPGYSAHLSLVISLVPEISPVLDVVENLLLLTGDHGRERLDAAVDLDGRRAQRA